MNIGRRAVRTALWLSLCLALGGCAEGTGQEESPHASSGNPAQNTDGLADAGRGDPGGDGGVLADGSVTVDGERIEDADRSAGGSGPKRTELTIHGSEVPSALGDFPVLVQLVSDAALADSADDSGLDIHFEDGAGNALPFERVSYDAGTLVAWVKMDLTGEDQGFYLYYGDGDVTDKATPAGVWTHGYNSTWQLEEAGHPLGDSTGDGNNSTSGSGVASIAGVVGNALAFDGTGTVQTPPVNPSALTLSLWVRLETQETVQRVVTTTPAAWLFDYRGNQGTGTERFRYWFVGATNYIWNAPGGSASPDGWNHYAVVDPGDGSTHPTLYKNGAPLAWESSPASWEVRPTAPTDTILGNGAGSSFDGALDQVSVSSVLRTAGWIAAEYNNQKPDSTFITLGPQEDL